MLASTTRRDADMSGEKFSNRCKLNNIAKGVEVVLPMALFSHRINDVQNSGQQSTLRHKLAMLERTQVRRSWPDPETPRLADRKLIHITKGRAS